MEKSFLKFWQTPCQVIYMVLVLLLFIGGINVFSASFVTARDATGSGLYYFIRYFVFAALGLLVMLAVRRAGYKLLLNRRLLWLAFAIVFAMLLYVDVLGVNTKGASRWIYLGPISIQPSEFAKLVVIMLAARYLGDMLRQGKRASLFAAGDHRLVQLAALAFFALVYKQPDLGTAAIIIALLFGMYIIAGIPAWQLAGALGVGCLAVIGTTLALPYRMARVKVWFDPWVDPRVDGYQMVQSLLAIGSGGMTGSHWGRGAGKFFYLPEAHTDFAFAIFCQENGFVGALILLFLFTLLALAFFAITCKTRDSKGFLLAGGITFLIIGQAAANMAMVCGLLPVIGVPLSFISYGGSSMILSMIGIGLLLSIYDEEEKQERQEALTLQQQRENFRVTRNERWRR